MRKVRKEFLSGAQHKRRVLPLRAERSALMFVSNKPRQQNMTSNTGATKAPLVSHRIRFLIPEEQKQACSWKQKPFLKNVFQALHRHFYFS